MPRIDQYPDATIPSLAADSLTAGKVEGIAVPGLAGHPYMLQGLGNRPGEPGVGKQARGVGMLRPPLSVLAQDVALLQHLGTFSRPLPGRVRLFL